MTRLINADKLKSEIMRELRESGHYSTVGMETDNALTVDTVEVAHAKWERKYDIDKGIYWYECSICGSRPPRNQWNQEYPSKDCPNCGAKMNIERKRNENR